MKAPHLLLQQLFKELAGVGTRNFSNLLWGSFSDHGSTAASAFWTHVHDPVGSLDHVEVVLDDDHGVTRVHQALDHHHEFANIFKVQTSSWLIEDVNGATVGTLLQLSGKFHTLGFTTRQGCCCLAQTDIAKADINQRC